MTILTKSEPKSDLTEYVLNGIAYIPESESEFLITGKCWDNLYRIKLT
jgi:glutamine cyclotransferase